jgi:1-deoxy-D-xylulose-5-phosphate reductoisomerase
LPIDSEHNAVFQVFDASQRAGIERIILTASGGPFREWTKEQIAAATLEQALKHPNWDMGQKITIDSASMMNKGLEVIEAYHLFNMPADKIDVIIHPQSTVHSMVEYVDGSVLAQMGASDMRTPIAYALGWPERIATPGARLNLNALSRLDFEAPDHERFPAMGLAYDALRSGSCACIALNAANEAAVDAFLKRAISFPDIVAIVQRVLGGVEEKRISGLEEVLDFDHIYKAQAQSLIQGF